ncbi:MAG: hypothetical protein HWN81_10095 [Candidatus Lokiarchaeota archaeon]|nr:hypothetical protein [Candidatus Lokiarchaeota archaeon]
MPIKKVEVKRGLAALLWQFIEPLNFNKEFKEKFGDTHLNILLNPNDQKWAALLKIEKGTIDAESIRNDKETLENLEFDSLFEAPAEMFLNLFSEGLSAGTLLKKMITRKIKLRGLRKMMALKEIFELLG